ncbi:MAG TPA: adenylate/guanylate cyclase domain-containing protein [Vineibacter sp.]|nr:adenylate/guanylate cyclase domain-containing protein [Vineibacter sp.]
MRTAAILSLDVVGYSAMARHNDRETVRAWKAREAYLSPVVARHRGVIFNTTGDGFLAAFGSAVEATACALEIQYHARGYDLQATDNYRMPLRIGVHAGAVVSLGTDMRGDVVNTATRVQSVGIPGEVCVSDVVAQQLRQAQGFSLTLHGEFDLKNIGRAPVYHVISPYMPAGGISLRLPPGRLARHLALAALTAFGITLEIFVWAAPVDSASEPGTSAQGEEEFPQPRWKRWLSPGGDAAPAPSPPSGITPAPGDPAKPGPMATRSPPSPAATRSFDGDWKGVLRCDQPNRSENAESLTVRQGEIWFQSQTPGSPRRFLLVGTLAADGRATLRGDGVDASNKPYEATFDIRVAEGRLTGRGRTSSGLSCSIDMTRR